MRFNVIQVFEYDTLKVGDKFRAAHFRRIVNYNEKYGNKFFSVGNDKIFFKQYVGVIQVGNLIIEILPKADKKTTKDRSSFDRWHNALIEMLRVCGLIKIEQIMNAHEKLKASSLIDIFFEAFLNEVKTLIHSGLIKSYRINEGNLNKLKGRLVFQRNIPENLVHKERFYTAHHIYDRDNIFNRIIYKAIELIIGMTDNQSLLKEAIKLRYAFEDVSNNNFYNEKTFDNLRYDRRSERYKPAINIAKLIILNYSPDLKAGGENVLAILFDMNVLFEKVIYILLKRGERKFNEYNLTVRGQTRHSFWCDKSIRPDVVLDFFENDEHRKIFVDTKWKTIERDGPSDPDLKQMYVYNVHLDSSHSILVYPHTENTPNQFDNKPFKPSRMIDGRTHYCGQYFVDLIDEKGNVRKNKGQEILSKFISMTRG